ncbi:hypothetical protein NF212_10935 [Parasalinivibrio latis]|uniref:hypothetical protein n=1 Tax=Parasalinivibrio latis TaxID=2952610 RepID=UPI0030E35BAB
MKEVTEETLAMAKSIGSEIDEALNAHQAPENRGRDILDLTPDSFRQRLTGVPVEELQEEVSQEYAAQNTPLMKSKFSCAACTTLTYAGIVAAVGATVIVSGGMSIAAVLAASGYSVAGLATIISAMTGVSVGAVTAMLSVSGVTLSVLVIGLCEKMGKC